MAVGGAIGISVLAPFVGIVGTPVLLTTAAVATSITAIDFTTRRSSVQKHYENRENILNSYLAQLGNQHSIEDIQNEWRQMIVEDLHSKWAVGLGMFDLYRIGTIVRKTSALSKTRSTADHLVDTQVIKNRGLLNTISNNPELATALNKLLRNRPESQVHQFLKAAAIFPAARQMEVLARLPQMASSSSLDLPALTAAINTAGIKSNIASFFEKYATCVFPCKLKPALKITKGRAARVDRRPPYKEEEEGEAVKMDISEEN